jgi:hypothetical protein
MGLIRTSAEDAIAIDKRTVSSFPSLLNLHIAFFPSISSAVFSFVKMGSPNEISASSAPDLDSSNEKITAVTQTDVEDLSKSDLHIDDEAGVVAAKALASGPADIEISKKVLRKIDLYILPFLCITYGRLSIPSRA